ncbi:acyl-CoA dehydrogenase family protein [Paenibacillus sp. SI8]|uniref:acyl-CoA dehydrogenase family protein n=1 Tax=unclassified Paenibacillus TaxID=185978 RepID=UPI00346741CB
MAHVLSSFAKTDEQRERLSRIGDLADSFVQGAHAADEVNGFSYTHIEKLRQAGYTAYTVPREYGGEGISIYELVLYQERLAQGDPSIALGMGWHLGVMYDLGDKRSWQEEIFARLCKEVVASGAIVNRAASEAATGSPSRGGKPLTTAIPAGNGYRLYGRKTFTTMAPVLGYAIVTATEQDTNRQGEYLIPMSTKGVTVEETWNMLGMRGTGSHDLVLDGVEVPREALVHTYSEADHQTANPFMLQIPACYLGIALAARKEALAFAASYQPNSLDRPILYTPNVGQLLGQIDLELLAARHFLYSAAARWDEPTRESEAFIPELAAVKTFAVQTALSVVDKAMRIVGAQGLAQSHPLQRLYRDVRFGLHNPPMDDHTIRLLSQSAIKEVEL